MTAPEIRLWSCLRGREKGRPAFRRQHPIGPFIDFFCAKAKLAVEIDGENHGFGDRPQRDARRDGWFKAHGIEVVRISASSVLEDPSSVAHGLQVMAWERTAR